MALSPSLQQRLFGSPAFAEHEELLAYQHRFLISIVLVSVAVNLLLVMVYSITAWGSSYLVPVACCWLAAAGLNLALWRWMLTAPRQLHVATGLVAGLYWLTMCMPSLWLPANPMLPMWTLLWVLGIFMLAGRGAGWASAVVAVVTAFWLVDAQVFQHYPHASTSIVLSTVGCALLGHFYLARMGYYFARLEHHSETLEHLATYDSMTGALNGRAYYAQCDAQLSLCQRLGMPAAVLYVDLDHFKRINAQFGHAMGDHVLQQASRVLQSCLRNSDLLGRVGGEEFSIFLPNTSPDGALEVAERIRNALAEQPMLFNGQVLRITASIGVTWSQTAHPVEAIHELQQRADRAMADAKNAGRNRVVTCKPEPVPA